MLSSIRNGYKQHLVTNPQENRKHHTFQMLPALHSFLKRLQANSKIKTGWIRQFLAFSIQKLKIAIALCARLQSSDQSTGVAKYYWFSIKLAGRAKEIE